MDWKGGLLCPTAKKMCLDYLCGNHARGLPIDEFNVMFDAYMEEELGEAFKEAQAVAGENNRIEKSGTGFIRALCKRFYSLQLSNFRTSHLANF